MGHYSDQYDAREKMARKIHEENIIKRREIMIAYIKKDLETRSLEEILTDILLNLGDYKDKAAKV